MNSTEIVAYIGALAWIPHLAQWIYDYFTKPAIRIIPDRIAEIGHTVFGPIFNLRLSIDVSKKDTVIDFIGVELKHENGATYNFHWMGMNEVFSEVIKVGSNPPNESQIVQKNVTPIALKISRLSLAEKYFRFQEKDFIDENRKKFNALLKEIETAKKLKKEGKNIDFIWRNLNEYEHFLREKFIWKAGTYSVNFLIRSPAKFDYIPQAAEFHLTQSDVDTLNSNFSEIGVFTQNIYNSIEERNEPVKEPTWIWINPEIHKK